MIDITQHALKGQKLCKLSGFLKLLPIVLKLLPLQGALFATHKNPGRCPGLGASALSGRVASSKYMINDEGMHVIRDNYCFSEKNVVSLHCRSKIG